MQQPNILYYTHAVIALRQPYQLTGCETLLTHTHTHIHTHTHTETYTHTDIDTHTHRHRHTQT